MLVKQGSLYHFRRVVPARLRGVLGRREIWFSLGTSDRHIARTRACQLYGCVEDWLVAAESRADMEAEIARLEAACTAGEADNAAIEAHTAQLKAQVEEIRHLTADAELVMAANARLAALNSRLKGMNVPGVLARQDGRLQESRRQADRVMRVAMAQPAAAPVVPQATAQPLMTSLVEAYFVQRETVAQATHQVMNQDRATLRRFAEVCGDRPVDTYRRADVTTFLGKLRQLPSVYGRSAADKEASFAELIARAKASGCETLSEKTVKRHLSALTQFFGFCVDQSHMGAVARAEMLDKHKLRPPAKGAREQRDIWTSEELVKLFSSPVWRGRHPRFDSRPGPDIIRDAVFWVPLLALFQGGRLEEYADLRVSDVISDDGVAALRIQESVDQDGRRRRLKTANSVRVVALHPEIIHMGFLVYVAAQEPDGALFPDLQPEGKDGKRGPSMTRWFGRYRKLVGVYRAGVGMHAFRHVANTRLRDAVTTWQQERHIAYMMGHSQGGGEGSERYDKGPGLKLAAATLALLTYPELDLSHLYVEA